MTQTRHYVITSLSNNFNAPSGIALAVDCMPAS